MLVNRVWLHHFGRGLVNTPADFGAMGEKPSHPELLDWLARDFVSRRLEAQAAAQADHDVDRLSAELGPRRARRRSSIRKIGCMRGCRVRRLDAEAVRDRILATSGVLNRKMFGPPVPVKEDAVGQIVVVGVDVPAGQRAAGRATRRFAAASTCRCAAASRWPCCTPSISR